MRARLALAFVFAAAAAACDQFTLAYEYTGHDPSKDVPDAGVARPEDGGTVIPIAGSTLDFSTTQVLTSQFQYNFVAPRARTVVGSWAFGLVTYDAEGDGARLVGLVDVSSRSLFAQVPMGAPVRTIVASDEADYPFVIESDRVEVLNMLTVKPEASWMSPTAIPAGALGAYDGDGIVLVAGNQVTRLTYDPAAPDRAVTQVEHYALSNAPRAVAVGGGLLYTLDQDGALTAWDARNDHRFKSATAVTRGSKLLAARGSHVYAAGAPGLLLLDFADPGAPKLVKSWPQFAGAQSITWQGPTLFLSRPSTGNDPGWVMDVTDPASPIPEARVQPGADAPSASAWATIIEHRPVWGTELQLTGYNDQLPYVAGAIFAEPLAQSVNVGAIVPVPESWPGNFSQIQLVCDGAVVPATLTEDMGDSEATLQPQGGLPANVDCTLGGRQKFHTTSAQQIVRNAYLQAPPAGDGTVNGFGDTRAVAGALSTLLVVESAGRLHLGGEWLAAPGRLDPECGFRVTFVTGEGTTRWVAEVQADGKVDAWRNGQSVPAGPDTVAAAVGFAATPRLATPHATFSLSVPAVNGRFGITVEGPDAAHHCSFLETEPNVWRGELEGDGTVRMVSPTYAPPPDVAPTPVSPADGAQVGERPTFVITRQDGWESFGRAELEILIGGEPRFTLPMPQNELTLSEGILQANAQYQWRARVFNPSGAVEGPIRDVTIRHFDPPPAPELTTPDDAATNLSLVPFFRWNQPGTPDGPIEYTIEISTSVAFDTLVASVSTTDLQRYGPPFVLQPQTLYRWRVRARNAGGSTVSESRLFTTGPRDTWVTGVDAPTLYRSGSTSELVLAAAGEAWVYNPDTEFNVPAGLNRLAFDGENTRPASFEGAPSQRQNTVATWTGDKLVVWGGDELLCGGQISAGTNTGSVYDPVADRWSATATEGAPGPRSTHLQAWTGTEVVVVGGVFQQRPDCNSTVQDVPTTGGRYNPKTNAWLPMKDLPQPRQGGLAVYGGGTVYVFGGDCGAAASDCNVRGVRYTLEDDTWADLPTAGAPNPVWVKGQFGTFLPASLWTGNELLIWGVDEVHFQPEGYFAAASASGAIYTPGTNTWRPMTKTGAPLANCEAAMTGSGPLFWCGDSLYGYDTKNDVWTRLPDPPTRIEVGRWDGRELLAWSNGSFRGYFVP